MTALLGALVVSVSGILFGVLGAVALGVVPAFRGLPPSSYIQVHRLVGQYYDHVMPPLVIGCTAADVALAFIVDGTAKATLFAAAAAAQLGVSLVSQLVNVPINKKVKSTDPRSADAGWDDPRPVWARWHLVRTALALVAVLANAAGLTLTQ